MMTSLSSRYSLLGFGLLISLGAVYYATTPLGGPWQAVVEGTRDAGFVLTDLKIKGADRTRRSDILAALDIDDGVPLLSIDLIRIREKLEQLNWVKSVELVRNLPSGLSISITERTPFALWQLNGKVRLIDPDGEVITSRGLGDFQSLMMVVGPDAHQKANDLQALLDTDPDMAQRVQSAVRISGRRWDVLFDNGMRLKLPEEEADFSAEAAWVLFGKLNAEHSLLAREISVVDVRVKDRVFLRLSPGVKRSEQSFETVT